MKLKPVVFALLCAASSFVIGFSKGKNDKDTNLATENTGEKPHYKLSDRRRYQEVEDGYFRFTVTPSGDAYMKAGNFPTSMGKKAKELSGDKLDTYEKIKSEFKTFSFKNYFGGRGPVEYVGKKLDISGVLSAYVALIGNGGSKNVYFVQEGGKVAYLCSKVEIENGATKSSFVPKKIEGIENVVSICENRYGNIPYAVCADGTEIELSRYR